MMRQFRQRRLKALTNTLSFYLDENLEIAIGEQLQMRGIDAVTVRDLQLLGDSDINHLHRASQMQRVLCTYDQDYLILSNQGIPHFGIVFGQRTKHQIGDWINHLVLMRNVYNVDDMQNRIEYL